MSYAATHRQHHVRVPWATVVAVAVAVALCTTAIVLVDRYAAQTATTPRPAAEAAPVAASIGAGAAPLPENLATRRHLIAAAKAGLATREPFAYPRNHVRSATAGVFTTPAAALRHRDPGGAPEDPRPFNHFPGEP